MELNPNHPVTQQMHDQWHKLAALAVMKAGGHVVISMEDLGRLPPGGGITVQELDDGLHLRLVDARTAEVLAKKEGGLPA